MTEVMNFEKQHLYAIGEIVRKRFKKIRNRISKKVDMDSFLFVGIAMFVVGILLLCLLIYGFWTGKDLDYFLKPVRNSIFSFRIRTYSFKPILVLIISLTLKESGSRSH